jgi:hypothetical protein
MNLGGKATLADTMDVPPLWERHSGADDGSPQRQHRALLRYANIWSIVDYWLAIYKEGEPTPSPFFVKAPAVQSLTLGQPSPSVIVGPTNPTQRASYASMNLKAGDYKVSVTFTRNDRKPGNVGGNVAALDADGNTQPDHLVGSTKST